MTDELCTLQDWLSQQNDIPQKRIHKETILDIAGIGHLENQWSNIYAYFINPNTSHGFKRLFIDSLLNILSKKKDQPPLAMNRFSVLREEPIKDDNNNKKRIDILIVNDDEAIIIENKVYAPLYNKLDLYWKRPNVSEHNKRGIVLSVWPISIDNDKFINITHEDYAHEIEKNLPNYITYANPKALILLQDFIQNIYNRTYAVNEQELLFYFENRKKINRLADIRNNVVKYFHETIGNSELLQLHQNDLELTVNKPKNQDNYCYYEFKALPDKVKLTLYYKTLWSYNEHGCRIGLFLELCGADMISFVKRNRKLLKEKYGIEPDGHKKEKTWWHYMGTDIRFDSINELSNEHEIVTRIINAIKESHFHEYGLNIIELYNNTQKSDTKLNVDV